VLLLGGFLGGFSSLGGGLLPLSSPTCFLGAGSFGGFFDACMGELYITFTP